MRFAPQARMQIIDSHQHFWRFSPNKYPWIKPNMKPIMRDFLPEDFALDMRKNRVRGCVSVQAGQSADEAKWLLQLANEHDFIRGVVVWANLLDDKLEKTLDDLTKLGPKLKGVRHMSDDGDLLGQKAFLRGLKVVERQNLAFDLLVAPEQLPMVGELLSAAPSLNVVLNHIGSPNIGSSDLTGAWGSALKSLASHPNLHCKLSGFITKAPWHNWRFNDFVPAFDAALNAFGPNKLLYGSDWPVLLLGTRDYADVLEILDDYFDDLPTENTRKIFVENASAVYSL